MDSQVTKQIVLQRIRNRVIELLEVYSDNAEAEMAHSLLVHWADWVESEAPAHFKLPVFTLEEVKSIGKTYGAWEHVEYSTPVESLQWVTFTKQSHITLNIMLKRGKQSEEYEKQF